MSVKKLEMMELEKKEVPMDTRRSWVVLTAAWLTAALTYGLTNSAGVYFHSLKTYFDVHDDQVAMVVGAPLICLTLSGPLSSYLYVAVGSRYEICIACLLVVTGYLLSIISTSIYHLIFTHLIVGLGLGIIAVPINVIITEYFRKHLRGALTIMSAGGAFGQIVMPFVFRYCIDNYGWHGMMLINAALGTQFILSAMILRQRPELHTERTEVKFADLFDWTLLKRPAFIAYWILGVMWFSCMLVFMTMSNELVVQSGIEEVWGSRVLSIFGAANLASRILSAFLANKFKKIDATSIIGTGTMLLGISTFAVTYCTNAIHLCLVFTIAGLGQGMAMAFVMVAFTDAFGMLALHRCIGAISFMTGTGLLAVPKIAGVIAETYSLSTTFQIFGPMAMMASIGYFVLAVRVRTNKTPTVAEVVEEKDENEAMIST